MSEMIQCDKCKKLMYEDSRSDKDAYCKLNITYVEGYTTFHLCKACHRQLMTEFLRTYTPEEYDETFREIKDSLVSTCHKITRKVKGALCT